MESSEIRLFLSFIQGAPQLGHLTEFGYSLLLPSACRGGAATGDINRLSRQSSTFGSELTFGQSSTFSALKSPLNKMWSSKESKQWAGKWRRGARMKFLDSHFVSCFWRFQQVCETCFHWFSNVIWGYKWTVLQASTQNKSGCYILILIWNILRTMFFLT